MTPMHPKPGRRFKPMLLIAWLILAICISFSAPAPSARAAATVYVTPQGAGNRTGSDWQNATTLQAALANAAAGDQIWVRAGVYLPGSARATSFTLRSGVAVYGGFAGDETDLGQRNPATNPSTLSGDIGVPGDAADNSYHVVSGNGVDQNAILDGFTISGGNANGASDTLGGGILLYQSSATIRNCVVRENAAETGGGIAAALGSPTLSQLVVENNQASYGGGMAIGNAVVSFVVFRHNRADYGGALEIENASPTIGEVVFSGNQAMAWGGALLAWRASPIIRQATLANNTAPRAGAIAVQETSLLLRNSVIWSNGDQPIAINITGTVDSAYNLIQGGYSGAENIDLDPQFANAAGADGIPGTSDDDLRLQASSPAINAGSNAEIPADLGDRDGDGITSEPIGSDLDGHLRIADGTVDLGAYEASHLESTFKSYLAMIRGA